MAVANVRGGAHVAEMSLEIRGEHSGVDGGGEFLVLRPIAGGVTGRFAGLADADSFQLPEIWIYAEDEDSGVANGRRRFRRDVFVVHAGGNGFPL